MTRVLLLGATGSIGDSTLDLLRRHPDQFQLHGLTAHTQSDKLAALAKEFNAAHAVITDPNHYPSLQQGLNGARCEAAAGEQAMLDLCADPAVDLVVAGIVGSAGMPAVMACVEQGKTLLLANKESLVLAGELVMRAAAHSGARIVPLDSEHNAIYQCLPDDYRVGQRPAQVQRVVLTASGGPFHDWPIERFAAITPAQAVAHPKWDMGAKISVDSATLMNKGLEVIEAHWLFDLPWQDIDVLVHPQSAVHSLVYFQDGSVLAQLGVADMRVPIAYALGLRKRLASGAEHLDLAALGQLTFSPPDLHKFPCLQLAYDALRSGGSAAAVLNAANEVAVDHFLRGRIEFNRIAQVNDTMMHKLADAKTAQNIEELMDLDRRVRAQTTELLGSHG